MQIIFLEHPPWVSSLSMPRFAAMLSDGMRRRGHTTASLTATSRLHRLSKLAPSGIRKWAGYVDQFAVFPSELRRSIRYQPKDTLYVLTDHALGMWVPLIASLPHVVHCHDFLAINSAQGRYLENPTGLSGRCYQSLIRRGLAKADAFICISEKTQTDLHEILRRKPRFSEVVYNPLRGDFLRLSKEVASESLAGELTPADAQGFFLHVGGNQWYKCRQGVVRLYAEWTRLSGEQLPLWMVGPPPPESLVSLAASCTPPGAVRFLTHLNDAQVKAAYSLAVMLLFPSLEEGFGWPIAEAMACGAPVLTTNSRPMTEVGGNAAIYHRRMTQGDEAAWATEGANLIVDYLRSPDATKEAIRKRGAKQARRFDLESALTAYEQCYLAALNSKHCQDC